MTSILGTSHHCILQMTFFSFSSNHKPFAERTCYCVLLQPSWRHLPNSSNYSMISYRGSDLKMDKDLGFVFVHTVVVNHVVHGTDFTLARNYSVFCDFVSVSIVIIIKGEEIVSVCFYSKIGSVTNL